ncbi:Beta-1,4 N-acetylgalactosaminyltransferase 2 [Anabarilius grahami]|uniref:Beta-1,4 N-acetylgalactosaminyltransferase 2 n=1 Tax=Anabarilius grahami TaxID=495550 RepID=A0A3N0Z8I5_ANAGA|nr:Beta-1,4 N-acetylgalactosaminyltransferase 2 [Anabarilius grahami]
MHGIRKTLFIVILLMGLLTFFYTDLEFWSKTSAQILRIGPFHNENGTPCTCQKTAPANQFVPKDELDDLQKRRAEEFRQHQIRKGKENDVLILAPANTPLQYPIRGFRVTPMNKTLIPDVNSQVTVLIKAFLRYKELRVLIDSIRRLYPKIKIIVADDSLNPEKVVGDNVEQYIMPPAQGWFAGRNLAVSQVTTKYFLWVDDDFVFLNETRIESFVNIMEAAPELDVVGGQVEGNQFFFKLQYEEGSSEEGGCITRVTRTHAPLPGFDGCFFADGVVNYFLGRTEAVRRVGFDPFLKRVAHTEFFVDGLGDLLVVTCKGLKIGHQKHGPTNKYGSFRHPPKSDSEAKITHHFFKNHLKCIKY